MVPRTPVQQDRSPSHAGAPGHHSPTSLAYIAFALLVSVACGQTDEEVRRGDDQLAAVRAVTARIIRADNAGDLDAVIELYTEDAVLLPPGRAPIEGRAAIREHYAGIFQDYVLQVEIASEETHVAGRWAFDRGRTRGRARPKGGGTAAVIDDKYVMVLRYDAEPGWRIARLIWNAAAVAAE